MTPQILNPEFKVGTLNPKTFESGEFCRIIKNGCLSNGVTIVVKLMVIDGGRWLPHSVTDPETIVYNA